MGKGRFLATKRAQKRACIVCLASAAILPFLMTSPDIQFWLSAAVLTRVVAKQAKTTKVKNKFVNGKKSSKEHLVVVLMEGEKFNLGERS